MGNKQTNSLGLSFSDRSIEIAEISLDGKGEPQIVAWSRVDLAPGVIVRGKIQDAPQLAEALRQAFAAAAPAPFSSTAVNVSLPDFVSYFHTFKFPGALGEEEVENALAFHLEEVIPFAPDDIFGDHVVLATGEKETKVAYAMALKEDVRAYLQVLKAAGLTAASVGLATQALSRLMPFKAGAGASLVVDIENASAAICLFDQQSLLATFTQIFDSSAPAIANPLQEGIAAKAAPSPKVPPTLTKTHAARLAKRLLSIVDWHALQNPDSLVDTIILIGEKGEKVALVENLGKKLDEKINVVSLDVLALFNDSPALASLRAQGKGAQFAEACGIALMDLSPRPGDFNLLKTMRAPRPAPERQSLLAVFKGIRLGPEQKSGLEGAELTVIHYRRRTILAGTFFSFAILLVAAAIGLRIQKGVVADAQERDLRKLLSDRGQEFFLPAFAQNLKVEVDPEAGSGILPARLFSLAAYEKDVPVDPALVGPESVARGRVVVRNVSGRPVTLVASTRLLSEDGVLFHLQDTLTVPSNADLEAEVYADAPGPGGNIGPSEFTFPGLSEDLQALVIGRSNAAMQGGLQIDPALAAGLLAEAQASAQKYVIENIRTILALDAADIVLADWVRTSPLGARFTLVAGAPAVAVEIKIDALVIGENELQLLLCSLLAQKAGVDVSAIDQPVGYSGIVSVEISDQFDAGEILVSVKRYPQVD